MHLQLLIGVIVITVNRGIFEGATHAFDLPIPPGMVQPGQPMLNTTCSTDAVKKMLEGVLLVRLVSELHAIVGEDG